jgi:hypothetical protein
MSPRKTSMLDAFLAPGGTEAGTERPAPARSSPPRPARERSGRAPAAERSGLFVLAGLGVVGALAGAFWLGRATAPSSEVLAASPRAERGERPASPSPAWQLSSLGSAEAERPAGSGAAARPLPDGVDESGRTADDRAFYERGNRFTVRAIRYANTQNGWQSALTVYRYLREQGLPAIAPIDQGDLIVLCVGAEPQREGRLEEIRQRLEKLPGPPPRNERAAFSGAYFDNIDHLIERP